jgi:CRP-like cAMP-binding protein
MNPQSVSAFDRLAAYLRDRGAFSDEELVFMSTLSLPRALRSGEFFQRAGDVSTHAAFIATGCLRSYVIDARGKEHIVQFPRRTGVSRIRLA